jgi:hypothetical protein
MKDIQAKEKTVRALLGEKYAVDDYQREYKWTKKQADELADDLLAAFNAECKEGHDRAQVRQYGQYFLGPIIVSEEDAARFIVDGQQRLTTLTLLLICLLHAAADEEQKAQLQNLICAVQYGKRSFNLDVPDRTSCLEALYEGEEFDADGESESVRNLIARHGEIRERLNGELEKEKIPLFTDWLIEKVCLVEIKASSGDDAYTIFETMNDRGLRLTPAEMLKGYLLSGIKDGAMRASANDAWKKRVNQLTELGKEEDADAIKSWLRAHWAESADDFEKIGAQFHRWVRDKAETLGLKASADFADFIRRDFAFYAKWYLRLRAAANKFDSDSDLKCVYYNAQHNFTMQYLALLAPLSPEDSDDELRRKLCVVATYLDILIHRQIGNWRSIAQRTVKDKIFQLALDIRRKSAAEIAGMLAERVRDDGLKSTFRYDYGLHGTNRRKIHCILARLTDYVETQSGKPSHYADYFLSGKEAFEIEHIWPADYEPHKSEFPSEDDFWDARNNIGGLLLLPKKDNASYGDMPYEKKREYYNAQNLLARSLHEKCYERSPGFCQFKEASGLSFKSHAEFKKADMDARQQLYRDLADQVWNPERLLRAAE